MNLLIKPFQYLVKGSESVALRANVCSEQSYIKQSLKIYIDMALHRYNDLVSCTFVKDWLKLGKIKNRFPLYFLSWSVYASAFMFYYRGLQLVLLLLDNEISFQQKKTMQSWAGDWQRLIKLFTFLKVWKFNSYWNKFNLY